MDLYVILQNFFDHINASGVNTIRHASKLRRLGHGGAHKDTRTIPLRTWVSH
jgi:hypothetical protein